MDILFSTDKNYIMPTGVAMQSVSSHNDVVTFHILIDENVSSKQKKQLENILIGKDHQKVIFYTLDPNLMKKFPALGSVKTYISMATYFRLFISGLLPDTVHKVIYLDGDIIDVKPLTGLWNVEISEYALGVVPDMAEDKHDFDRLGYSKDKGYFNAGVMLINLDYWRKNNLQQRFLDLILNHPERIVLHDQDVLNITLHDEKLLLPMKYNVQNGFMWQKEYSQFGDKYSEYEPDLVDAVKNPVIIHFTDNKKPWHVEDCNPLGYEWFRYFKQTEWKYQPLGHCNKSKIRYFVAKLLRQFNLLKPAVTDEYKYAKF